MNGMLEQQIGEPDKFSSTPAQQDFVYDIGN